ncbi:MAG: TetR/AcrR family transcriptional regulator [Thiohalomonadales bacterium]
MAQKSGKKEQTRKRMLTAASRSFREFGYSGVGVDGLAKAADVTSGAFYAHFGSKAGAFDASLNAGLDEVIEGLQNFQSEYGASWVNEFVEYYLGKQHRSELACSCAMASLTSEVVRSEMKVHAAYEKKMSTIVNLVAAGLVAATDQERRNKAWAMLSILIGGLNVVLAMKNSKVADEVAKAVTISALKVAGRARSVK